MTSSRSLRAPRALRGLGLLAASTLPALPFIAHAAEPQTLQPVVVTATRAPQPIDTVLADLRVIDADAIANAGPMTLTELLQIRGGVEISANGGPGQVSGVFLRGSNAGHVVLLVDGVRINSATAGTNAFENIPLAQIERIEILRGVGSSLYGADAIGGVIQVFTKNADAPRSEASVGLGQWDTHEASLGLARKAGATRWSLQAGWRESRGFSATNPAASFSYDPDADGYRNLNLGLNVEHELADGHSLALRSMASRGRTQFDAGPGTDDVNRQRLSSTALESRNRISADWRSLLRLARGADHIRTDGAFPGFVDTDQDQASWQNDVAALGGQWVAGLDWRREKVASDTAYTVSARRFLGAFAGVSARLGENLIEASARHDDDSQFGGHATGKLAWGYKLTPQWRASASYGTAFKAPSFNDLYYPLAFGFSGNPNLKPERARSAELALRHDGGALQGGVVLFASRVSDLIAVDPTFTTVINVNRARIRGITLDASWRSDIWTARGEFTHQDAEDADTGARLVRRARQYGSASLGVVQGPWRGGIEWVVSGDRFGAASNSAASRMGGYGLVNLNASWAVTPRWTLAARLNNLTGRRYELVQGYNTPGSNLFVSLAYADL
ncbi:MAG: TonB-dependent receptor [Piscinibacter sp.]|jgi:vitamin B12 transporter|uniref:TonB-dependent receptor domain-containing protein n=1 Tax=Piscinibacter sp. TaxID=1903157 RepID=UPI0035AE2437